MVKTKPVQGKVAARKHGAAARKPVIADHDAVTHKRMPPKRTSTLRVRYIHGGKGQPRAYPLEEQ